MIERYLDPLYQHLSATEHLFSPGRLGLASSECQESSGAGTARFDSVRLNLQELVDIFAKVSSQRLQRPKNTSGKGSVQTSAALLKGGPALGLFQLHAARPNSVNLATPLQCMNDLPALPYFNRIEQCSRRIAEYYIANKDLVNQLCTNKREYLQKFFGLTCSKLITNSMLQVDQKDIVRIREPISRSEARHGKRNLSEHLAQGDFFSGSGKLGYYYQDRDFLCELEFEQTNPTWLQSSLVQYPSFFKHKRLKVEGTHSQPDGLSPEKQSPKREGEDGDTSDSPIARKHEYQPKSFTLEHIRKRTNKMLNKQGHQLLGQTLAR